MATVGLITSANSVYSLGVLNLFPVAQTLQNYSTDSAFDTDAVEMAVVEKGVDGLMVAGWVPFLNMQTIMLSAASTSNALFDQVIAAQKTATEVYEFFGTIKIPAIKTTYTLTGGILTRAPIMPGVRKTLQPRSFQLTWGDITPSPMSNASA